MSARYIEYYEVKTVDGYEYYFMPVDKDAKNKHNFDWESHRIWKVHVKSNRVTELKNIRKDKPQLRPTELLTIQLIAKPVPWDEGFLYIEKARERRAQRELKKSNSLD